jgi:hypothetical protein
VYRFSSSAASSVTYTSASTINNVLGARRRRRPTRC